MKVDSETKVGISVVVFAIVAFVAALEGILGKNTIVLSFVVAIANIVMAGVIALQAVSMNESVLEIKKERMNIEEFKNSLIAYLQYLKEESEKNLTSTTRYKNIKKPYQYIVEKYKKTGNNPSPLEVGLAWRISVFIEKFFEVRGFSLQELDGYNKLIDESIFASKRQERISKIREKSEKLKQIAEMILQELKEASDKELEERILEILEF